jgi:hypothetical protein
MNRLVVFMPLCLLFHKLPSRARLAMSYLWPSHTLLSPISRPMNYILELTHLIILVLILDHLIFTIEEIIFSS